MTDTEATTVLINFINGVNATTVAKRQALDAITAILDNADLIQRQHASRELERLGHIVRHALTPDQYYAAEQAARQLHPEAWGGRLEGVQP